MDKHTLKFLNPNIEESYRKSQQEMMKCIFQTC